MLNALPVFYSERMVADSGSFSPSAAKPREALASWKELGVPLQVRAPTPVTSAQLCLAHDKGFVADVLACRASNGFGNRSKEVADSLLYTSGSMLSAAREALANALVAVATCSGFHHARYDSNGGYCTFNGLLVAARVLHEEGLVRRVGILDFEQHYGDGTADIIGTVGLDFIIHYTAGRQWSRRHQAARFLRTIPEIMAPMRHCDLILYQAGADPHVDDPLGGWLTTEELAFRDRTVFETAYAFGVPVAWNLAGGYQAPLRKVLDIHDNTLGECWRVYGSKGGKQRGRPSASGRAGMARKGQSGAKAGGDAKSQRGPESSLRKMAAQLEAKLRVAGSTVETSAPSDTTRYKLTFVPRRRERQGQESEHPDKQTTIPGAALEKALFMLTERPVTPAAALQPAPEHQSSVYEVTPKIFLLWVDALPLRDSNQAFSRARNPAVVDTVSRVLATLEATVYDAKNGNAVFFGFPKLEWREALMRAASAYGRCRDALWGSCTVRISVSTRGLRRQWDVLSAPWSFRGSKRLHDALSDSVQFNPLEAYFRQFGRDA